VETLEVPAPAVVVANFIMGDDFSDQVRRALAARVGNLCSNPDCRALTSGPQDDPAKSVNVGVAAHITAASPGGPRHDSNLLSEERCAPANGIWLCQNCAKLVDNDPIRFTTEVLTQWKRRAEMEARNRVGRTAGPNATLAFNLRVGSRVRIEPIVPSHHEQREWIVMADTEQQFKLRKGDSASVELPKSFIERIHNFGDQDLALIQLSGRLQWVSVKHHWVLFSGKPADALGISKDVDFQYPTRQGITDHFTLKWCREDRLALCLDQGWHVFYDDTGRYLCVPGPDIAQILICDRP
jgi:hypothetical protein